MWYLHFYLYVTYYCKSIRVYNVAIDEIKGSEYMKVEEKRLDYFFYTSKDIVIEVLERLEEYKKYNTYFPKYRNYPAPFLKI